MASTSTNAAATESILTPSITLKGHGKGIESISYFPDGQRMISGSLDKTTRQWDLKAGKEIEEARGVCEEGVYAVAVSRDGLWVATGGERGELKACEVETGIVKTFKGHSNWINCIDISADSKLLASGSGDKTAQIWNLDTGKLVAGPFKSENPVGAVRFSPDSKKLAVMSWSGTCLEVWDVESEKLDVKVGEYRRSGDTYAPVLWTNNNKTIIAAFDFTGTTYDEITTIYEFDASTLETVGIPFKGHTNLVSGLALSFDQALLASASYYDHTIKLWAFESRQLLASFDVQNILRLVLSPDSCQLAYTIHNRDKEDYKICICDTPPKFLAQARNIARKKSYLDHLLHSHATRPPAGYRRPPISMVQRSQPTRDPAFLRLSKLLRFSRMNAVRPGRKDQSRDPLDFSATLPLPSNRIHGESAPSTSFPGGSAFFNPTRSSSGKGKQKARGPKRTAMKVVDVPLGQVTYGDAVGVDDGYRPYVVFFCLSWFQKKEKKPEPRPVYDDELDDDDDEEENVPVAVPPPRVQHEEIELKTMVSQSQPKAGPSRLAVTRHVEAQSSSI